MSAAKVIVPAKRRDAHGMTRQRVTGPGGVVFLGATAVLAMTGGLQMVAVAYGMALLAVICLIAVAVPVIVVWSVIEEAMAS